GGQWPDPRAADRARDRRGNDARRERADQSEPDGRPVAHRSSDQRRRPTGTGGRSGRGSGGLANADASLRHRWAEARSLSACLPYGPPSRPFTSVDELIQVPGMTQPLLARVRGYLSVYQPGLPVAPATDGSLSLLIASVSGGVQSPDDGGAGNRVIELRSVA